MGDGACRPDAAEGVRFAPAPSACMGVRLTQQAVTQSLHIPKKGLLDDGCLWNVLTVQSVLPTEGLERMASICLDNSH